MADPEHAPFRLPRHLLWEYDPETFDYDRHYRIAIERVIERGGDGGVGGGGAALRRGMHSGGSAHLARLECPQSRLRAAVRALTARAVVTPDPQVVRPETFALLRRLMADAALGEFFLVGGTALALYYGHRLSIDLALFTRERFDSERLREHLYEVYGFPRRHLPLREILVAYERKYPDSGVPLAVRSLTYFDDVDFEREAALMARPIESLFGHPLPAYHVATFGYAFAKF